MENYICITCGTQFAETAAEPDNCLICEDERQYIGHNGQQWTTMAALRSTHHNRFVPQELHLTGIGTVPSFAIGQRALLVQTAAGNVLWDCISLLDEPTITYVNALGGIDVIAISHPHFYSSMVEWSRAFDAPIYLHEAEREWVMRPDPAITFWSGETHNLLGDLTLIRCGGHFPGAQVLHWPAGADGKGALLTADILSVTSDRRHVSFMYSFPNYIPLHATAVRKIITALEPFAYDRIYGGWFGTVIPVDAQASVARSAERYIAAITPTPE